MGELERAVWIMRNSISTIAAVDDALAAAVARGIRDLVVQPPAPGPRDLFADLVARAAFVGVDIHAWVEEANIEDLEAFAKAYPIAGIHAPPQGTPAWISRLAAARPRLVRSSTVFPDPVIARDALGQDWPSWVANGWVELVCPTAYQKDPSEVRRSLSLARATAPDTRMWAGLLGGAREAQVLRGHVRAAADAGCDGVILFAYDAQRTDLLDALAA